jgi:hypothetical protein
MTEEGRMCCRGSWKGKKLVSKLPAFGEEKKNVVNAAEKSEIT